MSLLRAGAPVSLVVLALLAVPGAQAAPPDNPILVNTLGDASDAAPNDGRCDSDLGTSGRQCTLRAAIETANCVAVAACQYVKARILFDFDFPGNVYRQINLTALGGTLTITRPVEIDMRNVQEHVRINGAAVAADCLIVNPPGKGNVTLYGLHLFGCGGTAIHVVSGEGEIGAVGAGNWIVNSTGYGIHVDSIANGRHWTIRANHIGFLPNGTNGTNGLGGIQLTRATAGGDGEHLIIGGLDWRAGNHIGNNGGEAAIKVLAYDDVRILSNRIGTNITWQEWKDVLEAHEVSKGLTVDKWRHGNDGLGILLVDTANTRVGFPPLGLYDLADARGNNTIWFNSGGIKVVTGTSGHDNYLRGNSFFATGEAILNDPDEPLPWRPGIVAASAITDKITVRLQAGDAQARNDIVLDLYGMDSCTLAGSGSRVAWLGGFDFELDSSGRIRSDDEVVDIVDKALDPWSFVSAIAHYIDDGLLTTRFGGCFPVSHAGFTATASTSTSTTTRPPVPTVTATATVTGAPSTVTVGPGGPQAGDSDGDGLSDSAEVALGTDPFRWDTDGDGISDFDEVAAGTDPLSAASRPAGDGGGDDTGETPLPGWLVIAALAAALVLRRRFPA